jgi:hypothetical protein
MVSLPGKTPAYTRNTALLRRRDQFGAKPRNEVAQTVIEFGALLRVLPLKVDAARRSLDSFIHLEE